MKSLLLAAVTAAVATFAPAVHAATPLSGTLLLNNEPVVVAHVTAHLHDSAEGQTPQPLMVAFTDRPLPAEALEGPLAWGMQTLAREGAVRGVLVRLDTAKPNRGTLTVLEAPGDAQASLVFVSLSSSDEPVLHSKRLRKPMNPVVRNGLFAIALVSLGAYLASAFNEHAPTVVTKTEVVKEYVVPPASSRAGDADMAVANPLGVPMAAAPQPAKSEALLRPNDLGQRLTTAPSVAEFVADALSHPEKGGGFYSLIALQECEGLEPKDSLIRYAVQRDTTISAQAIQAVASLRDRCAGLERATIESLKTQARQLGADGKDPVLAANREFRKAQAAGDHDTARRLLTKIVTEGNTALASQLNAASRLMQYSMQIDSDGATVATFNGQKYVGVDERALHLAALVSTCTDADYCQLDGMRSAYCRNSALCYSSREEFIEQTFYKGDAVLRSRARAFAKEIQSAMARGDASIFR